jgi:TPR repeat protein
MRQQQTQIAISVDNKAESNTRLIMTTLLVVLMTCLLFSITSKSHAGNHCCMLNELDLVTSQGVMSISYQAGWKEKLRKQAKAAFLDGDYHLARRLWRALAYQGDTDAAFRLGMAYDTGKTVQHDARKAAYWYRRAAEQGHRHAQHNLAVAYANGEGVELDIKQAIKWWKMAARQGNSDSQYNLGIIYAMGSHGVERNIAKAKQWWRKAAMNGDAMAQYNLGTLYANVGGQVRSYCEATRWWEKSANAGIKQASWALEVIKTHKEYTACW